MSHPPVFPVEAQAAQGRDPVPLERFTTADLPPEDRYRAWHLRGWPRAKPIYRTDPTEPFDTSWLSGQLGPVTLARVEITAMRWERRLHDIRGSDFDPIIISMMRRGEARGDFNGRPFAEGAGELHFHDLGRPSLHVSTASLTDNLIVPRPVAEAAFGPLHDLHGLVAPPRQAAIALALAEQAVSLLPTLDVGSGERLGRALVEVVAVVRASVAPLATDPVSSSETVRRRAVDWLDRNLGSGAREIRVDELCDALAISRRRLFEAFRRDGGVWAYATTLRLERARLALAEPFRDEPIGALAHRLGFSDASHLSRSFRKRYGMTPREYRRLRRADRDLLGPDPATGTPVQD